MYTVHMTTVYVLDRKKWKYSALNYRIKYRYFHSVNYFISFLDLLNVHLDAKL